MAVSVLTCDLTTPSFTLPCTSGRKICLYNPNDLPLETSHPHLPKKGNTSSVPFFPKASHQNPIQPLCAIHQTDKMKLISFAAISLLAITVSAWPPNSPSAQDIQESQDSTVRDILQILDSPEQDVQQPSQDSTSQNTLQDQGDIVQDIQQSHEDSIVQGIQQILKSPAQGIQQSHEDSIVQGIQQILKSLAPDIPQQSQGATQSSQQSDRDKVQAEIDRLKLALDVQEHQFSQIDNYINSEKQKVTEIQAMIRKGAIKLQGISISMDERLRLQQNIYDLRMLADELTAKYREQYYAYIDAMTECGTAKAELQMLKYNQKLIAEYNADHEDQARFSIDPMVALYSAISFWLYFNIAVSAFACHTLSWHLYKHSIVPYTWQLTHLPAS
ncbi:hypothetical protein BASA60_008400 [Batrachochytrium salamandrivorans]|nr:hypothetical protein BASA60_008400 [Batrachochytrium salamandrivorans]